MNQRVLNFCGMTFPSSTSTKFPGQFSQFWILNKYYVPISLCLSTPKENYKLYDFHKDHYFLVHKMQIFWYVTHKFKIIHFQNKRITYCYFLIIIIIFPENCMPRYIFVLFLQIRNFILL